MDPDNIEKLRKLTSFEALVDYLRDDLDWPIEADDAEKVAFDYDPKELRIDPQQAVKIESIKQIRPLSDKQPWGVFYIQFENKNLPVVLLRRILHALVPASRQRDPDRKAWKMNDLLFISSQGTANDRSISFAHFQEVDGKAQLHTFAWDVRETHLYYIKNLNLNALHWPADVQNEGAWRRQWGLAFTVPHRYVPTTAEMLSKEMARIAKDIREAVTQIYGLEHSGGPLHQLHLSLKMDLISDLSEADFADMYAQTVTYGLFAARATRSGDFKSTDATALIAHTNPFLRELLEQMMDQESLDLDELGVTELTDLLGKVNMEAILQSFGRQKHGEDPVIHFYETFIREYDPDQKTKRGEFYTPDPVVSFIVRSVDYLLRTEFDCTDGFATTSESAKGFQPVILDPATGTGTFLKYVIEVIWETFYEKNKKMSAVDRRVMWNRFVRESVLPRLYAFELKMSPYTIAHMKVGLALQQTGGFEFNEGERLRIYLTNSLQPAHEIARVDTAALAHEAERANEVKNNAPITVILGNPPYSNFGMMNKGDWILDLLSDYKKDLNEKKINIEDDYIKFIRFAHWKLEKAGQGILAYITNSSFLDGITHRAMRKSLMQTFDEIYILDVHGSVARRNEVPNNLNDENVFDIQQGVAISFFVKKQISTNKCRVFRADLFGTREQKYSELLLENISTIKWEELRNVEESSCLGTFYFFTPKAFENIDEYCDGKSVKDIFKVSQNGIKTDRDELFIDIDKNALEKRMKIFFSPNGIKAPFKDDYRVENSSSYDLLGKRQKSHFDPSFIYQCLYRPFDYQWIYYQQGLTSRPAWDAMQHMIHGRNLSLITTRQTKFEFTVLCTRGLSEKACANSLDINTVIPLYLYHSIEKNPNQISLLNSEGIRTPNINQAFLTAIANKIGLKFVQDGAGNLTNTFGPEDIFYYMYAIFHSPAYRGRYAEFLKIDFPRLPLTSNVDLFCELCTLGKELVIIHLLESSLVDDPHWESPVFFNGDEPTMPVAPGYPKFDINNVMINASEGFKNVPEVAWNFQVGGYQICEKWLKDRRGRQLSREDIAHYQKIVYALGETIRLMGEVDVAIVSAGGWPIK